MKQKSLKIIFISPKRYSFYPLDYQDRGLGGTESMLVLLSEALAKRGHQVEVYNCCYKPGIYNGVNWKPLWSFFPKKKVDITISLRLLETFKDYNINSKLRAVWIHDESLKGATKFDQEKKVNLWIFVSNTQKDFILKSETVDNKNIFVTRNAFDANIYCKLKNIKKVSGQAIYCSAPDRGLSLLLDFWPSIKKEIPWAKLIVTSSFALWGNTDSEYDLFFKNLYQKVTKLKDVFLLKRCSKKELSILQAESELMLYPTIFNEMFCISALECLSVGTPIISTSKAAIKERIINGVNGYLISGSANSFLYKQKFIKQTVKLFKNNSLRKSFSNQAINLTTSLNFDNLALDWEKEIIKRLKKVH